MKIYKLVLICFILAHVACMRENITNKAIIEVDEIPDSTIVLNKWQVIGLFPSENTKECIKEDNLTMFGLKESQLCLKDFNKINKQAVKGKNIDSVFFNTFYKSGNLPLDFNKIRSIEKWKGNIYSFCQINCSKDIETRLHYSCTGAEKVWLNGKLINSNHYSRLLSSYDQFIPISLKKGINTLVIKIYKESKDCQLYARLENTSQTALRRQFEAHNHWILDGSIITIDTIKLDIRFPRSNGKLTIFDQNKKILFEDSIFEKKTWSRSISSLKIGIYSTTFEAHHIKLTQDFYRGDIHDTIPKIIKELNKLKVSERTKSMIDPLIFRYNHLRTQTYPGDKKYVNLFVQLNTVLLKLKNSIDPFHHTSGCFIRTYISEIDSSRQYYILHVPTSYKKEVPMPIAVIIPATVGDQPYLKSFRVANSRLIDYFQDLAEKFNIIIIEPSLRRTNKPNFNTIEEAEFFNVVSDVKRDYHINMNKFFLTGTCSGGNEALRLAIYHPDFFAAVGLVSPEVIFSSKDRNSTIKSIKNIINLPFFNMHSVIDRHLPIARSEMLSKIANDIKMKDFTYIRMPNEFPMFYADDFFDNILEFCTKYVFNPSPSEIDFTTPSIRYRKSFWISLNDINSPDTAHIHAKINGNTLRIEKENVISYSIDLNKMPFQKGKALKIIDNKKVVYNGIIKDSILQIGVHGRPSKLIKNSYISGPFSHVFDSRFVVVPGTSGNDKEVEASRSIADTIQKYWQIRYYTPCLIMDDRKITEDEIKNSNLILLGNFSSNKLINKLKDKLPLKITENNIQISKKVIKGNKLCFYLIYPNPLNQSKYVAIIGYNHPEFILLGAETSFFDDVSNYGWCDYKVWGNENPEDNHDSGFFSHFWE